MRHPPMLVQAIGLMAVFPLLVALQLVLLALDAESSFDVEGWWMYPLAFLAWFVGPVLFVVGAFMLFMHEWTFLPPTRLGKLSAWMLCAAAVSLGNFFVAAALGLGPNSPEKFFDNLYLALPLTFAGACLVASGALAGYAILRRHERSLLAVGAVVCGLGTAFVVATEIAGHEEPGASHEAQTLYPPTATAPNSHSHASVVNVAPGEVLVSFDYANNHDPVGAKITAVTVRPLDTDLHPIADAEPQVESIERGEGHLELTWQFSQLSQLGGFSICFTGPGEPDLGCTIARYEQ